MLVAPVPAVVRTGPPRRIVPEFFVNPHPNPGGGCALLQLSICLSGEIDNPEQKYGFYDVNRKTLRPMSIVFDASELSEATASGESGADAFDPGVHFERWLQKSRLGGSHSPLNLLRFMRRKTRRSRACVSSLDTEGLFVYDVSSPLGG